MLVVARPSVGTRERVGICIGKRVCLPLAGLCRCFAIFHEKIILAGVCSPHVSTNAVIPVCLITEVAFKFPMVGKFA